MRYNIKDILSLKDISIFSNIDGIMSNVSTLAVFNKENNLSIKIKSLYPDFFAKTTKLSLTHDALLDLTGSVNTLLSNKEVLDDIQTEILQNVIICDFSRSLDELCDELETHKFKSIDQSDLIARPNPNYTPYADAFYEAIMTVSQQNPFSKVSIFIPYGLNIIDTVDSTYLGSKISNVFVSKQLKNAYVIPNWQLCLVYSEPVIATTIDAVTGEYVFLCTTYIKFTTLIDRNDYDNDNSYSFGARLLL